MFIAPEPLQIWPMCAWDVWLIINSVIKSCSTDNSWDTLYTIVISLHLFPATPNRKISNPPQKTQGKHTKLIVTTRQHGYNDYLWIDKKKLKSPTAYINSCSVYLHLHSEYFGIDQITTFLWTLSPLITTNTSND